MGTWLVQTAMVGCTVLVETVRGGHCCSLDTHPPCTQSDGCPSCHPPHSTPALRPHPAPQDPFLIPPLSQISPQTEQAPSSRWLPGPSPARLLPSLLLASCLNRCLCSDPSPHSPPLLRVCSLLGKPPPLQPLSPTTASSQHGIFLPSAPCPPVGVPGPPLWVPLPGVL